MPQTFVYVELPGAGFVPCGVLTMREEAGRLLQCEFRYGTRYPDRADAFPIDPQNLPFRERIGRVFEAVDLLQTNELLGSIRDASPDGYGRSILERACNRSHLDEFEYLTASGSHRVGALAFGPDLSGPRRNVLWTTDREPAEEVDLDAALAGHLEFERDEAVGHAFHDFLDQAASLGGMRPKASVRLDRRMWLAKFPKSTDEKDNSRIEFGVMNLASAAGFDVPSTRLENVAGRNVFLIERFDRQVDGDGAVIARIPFASALSLVSETENTARFGSYEDIASAIRRFSPSASSDMRVLFGRAAFNVLVSNDDDHLRNQGFLYDHRSRGWRLAPLYDVCPRATLSTDRSLAIPLRASRPGEPQEDRSATIENLLSSADRFGIGPEEAARRVSDLAVFVAANWERGLREAGLSPSEVERMSSCFVRATEIQEDSLPRP